MQTALASGALRFTDLLPGLHLWTPLADFRRPNPLRYSSQMKISGAVTGFWVCRGVTTPPRSNQGYYSIC